MLKKIKKRQKEKKKKNIKKITKKMGKDGIESKLNDYAVKHRSDEGYAIYATPLADDDFAKKCLKLVKKAAKAKKLEGE